MGSHEEPPGAMRGWPRGTSGMVLRKICLVVLVGVIAVIAQGSLAAGSLQRPAETLLGCPAMEPMVIANVDCTLGVADAFDHEGQATADGTQSDPGRPGHAPWCADFEDLTVYGCAGGAEASTVLVNSAAR